MTGVRVSSSYGIDAGDGFLAVVRAARSPRGLAFTTVLSGTDPVAEDARQSAASEMALAAARRISIIAAALPARDSVVRRLTVPMPSVARARRVLPSLLDVRLPFRLEDCAFAFPVIRRTPDGRVDALAVAAPRSAVERRLAALKGAGFDPMILDAEAPALWARAQSECPATGTGIRVVAHFAPDRLVLAVGRGEDLESVVTLREGLGAAASDAPGSDRAAMLQRIRPVLGTDGSAEWIWTGPRVEGDPEAVASLERDLGAGADVRWIRAPEPATFLARALAARVLSAGPGACNLRQGNLAHAGFASWGLAAGRRAAVACIAAGLILAAFQVSLTAWMSRREADVQRRLESESRRVGRLAGVQRGQELRMARDAVARRTAALAPVARLFEPSAVPGLAGMLRLARNAGLTFEVVELADDAVRVEGTSPDRDACGRIEDFLRLQGYRTRSRRNDEAVDGRVPFTIEGDRK